MIEALNIFHLLVGVAVLFSSVMVITAPTPVVSALFLLASLFLTGALYFSMGAYFVGAVQILIYAGAIAVLFVFLLMLLDLKSFRFQVPVGKMKVVLCSLSGVAFFVVLAGGYFYEIRQQGQFLIEDFNMSQVSLLAENISTVLLSKYMVAFQVAGFLILASVLGVVVLGKTDKKDEANS